MKTKKMYMARVAEINEALGEVQWEAQRTKGIMIDMAREIEERREWQDRAEKLLLKARGKVNKSLDYQINRLLKGD